MRYCIFWALLIYSLELIFKILGLMIILSGVFFVVLE